MSTTVPSGLNGRMKKTLAFQLDRLDSILDGLAEALNGAVADAVKETVGDAARQAVQVALDEAHSPAAVEKPKTTNVIFRCWNQFKAKVTGIVGKIMSAVTSGFSRVRKFGSSYLSATVLAVQSGVSAVKSRSLRIGMMLGAIASCVVSLLRKDAKLMWWGAGMIVCTMILESYLGTLATLVLGGSMIYLTTQPLDLRTVRQAA